MSIVPYIWVVSWLNAMHVFPFDFQVSTSKVIDSWIACESSETVKGLKMQKIDELLYAAKYKVVCKRLEHFTK